mmetsp:Transcript_28048/g.85693  ORF Transcript_28048/g.85693 Transcript_28048/m.85693 type:complete len:595 (-) Transcript_28048:65-1849(-)
MTSLTSECLALLRLSVPLGFTSAARIGQLLTDQAILGHLRGPSGAPTAVYLDASSLALLWMNLTNGVVVRGVCSAAGVLVAQALGARAPDVAGIWVTLALLFTLASSVMVAGLWFLTPVLLGAFISDKHAVSLAAQYARLSVGWLLPTQWLEVLNATLSAQEIVLPQLLVYPCFLGLNGLLNWLFVLRLGLGFKGSPLGTTSTRIGMLLSMMLLSMVLPRCCDGCCRDTHHNHRTIPTAPSANLTLPQSAAQPLCPTEDGEVLDVAAKPKEKLRLRLISPASLRKSVRSQRIRTFLKQTLPTLLSTLLEEIQLEAVGLLAGRLGVIAMSTHSSMLMTFFWLTAPMYGLVRATSIRTSHHLGAGSPHVARQVAMLGYACCCGLAMLVSLTLLLTRNLIGAIFSSDAAVITMTAEITPIVAGAYILVGIFYGSVATLNGQGRPLPVALAFLLGAFLISPCAGYVLAERLDCCSGVALRGIWLGLIAGYFVTSTLVLVAVCRSDWNELSLRAIARNESIPTEIGTANTDHFNGNYRHTLSGEHGDQCSPSLEEREGLAAALQSADGSQPLCAQRCADETCRSPIEVREVRASRNAIS